MPPLRYLFFSHDGFGLGHIRRNWLIARALLERDPEASGILVTGLPFRPPWSPGRRLSVVQVPPLLKATDGNYRASGIDFDEAVRERADIFRTLATREAPDVIIVDRHPYGTAGELREGLLVAQGSGARLVLGLRDVLDDPEVVRAEVAGEEWEGVGDLYDEVLVYGERHVCDHEAEYGLRRSPHYCGWVVGAVVRSVPAPNLLAVAAGGGADGATVFALGVALVERRAAWRGHLASGPYADIEGLRRLIRHSPARRRLTVDAGVRDGARLSSRAAAVLQMAGYNSTYEALAAGQRPILLPRRAPRREQAIRAERLSALGLCDVVAEGPDADNIVSLLDSRRRLAPGELHSAGIRLDGATRAARVLEHLALGGRR